MEEEHAMAMEEEEHAMASRLQEWLLHVERELQERESTHRKDRCAPRLASSSCSKKKREGHCRKDKNKTWL
jgi:hypothetical protein